jgi:energy-coupling factor transporter ATP-binding protein EcfA2
MCKIKIKNFGPIKEGFDGNDGWMDIKKVTVLIGNQGSGKSTVAKLVSTLMWIEKALVRRLISEEELKDAKKIIEIFQFQGLHRYLKKGFQFGYQGAALSLWFDYNQENQFEIEVNRRAQYAMPKIMYVPSERNFLSMVPNFKVIQGLTDPLYVFADEFLKGLENLDGDFLLPINGTALLYDRELKRPQIRGQEYLVNLSESSSGFQSLVPVLVVSHFLANSLTSYGGAGKRAISLEEAKSIREEIEAILNNENISPEVKKVSLEVLSSKVTYSSFINIIEEPEQNLFPSSQKKLLASLLQYNNLGEGNKLVLETHSPYIVHWLSLAVQAESLVKKIAIAGGDLDLLARVDEIVPRTALVNQNDLAIFQLDDFGNIRLLPDYEGIPADDHALNQFLIEGNDQFGELLEIEEELLNMQDR